MRTFALLAAVLLATSACAGQVPPHATAVAAPTSTAPPAVATPAATPAVPLESPTTAPGWPTPPPGSPTAALVGELRSDTPRHPADRASDADLAALVAADTDFAFDLYRLLAGDAVGDLFMSPYSISTALSMTYAGARGDTARQMENVLGVGMEPETWHAARNRLELDMLARARQPSPIEGMTPLVLEPTNAIFGQDGYPFEQDFLDLLAGYYGAPMHTVDFVRAPEPARMAVNEWVEERTQERIRELLAEGTVTDMTRFVLVNAIYFKATWLREFDPELTEPAPFHLLDGSTTDVPLMHGFLRTDYSEGADWQAVRLPYLGASMLVIVPREGSFADVERRLDAPFLAEVTGSPIDAGVDLRLPKWESATAVELQIPLAELGMADLFEPYAADLTGIEPTRELYVTVVAHQANVSVDEVGTEAAAATAVVGEATSGPERNVSLTVDRPFIYLIHDSDSGEILFLGRVLAPHGGRAPTS